MNIVLKKYGLENNRILEVSPYRLLNNECSRNDKRKRYQRYFFIKNLWV
jgi:hypothetical protein